MPIDEQRAYDHYRWATRYGKMGMEKKAKAHIDRAMHYGAPPSKKQKLGPTGPTGLTGLAGLMGPYEAFRVLGASHTARSTDPFPERSAKVRYETLKQEHKDDPGKLADVERAYATLLYRKLVDPPLPRAKKQPTKPAPSPPQSTGSDMSPTLRAAYDTLGVSPGALDAAKKAYRALALEVHPDKPQGTTEQMQRLNYAYEVIKNAQKFGKRYVRTRGV